jgi:hypothetical protein
MINSHADVSSVCQRVVRTTRRDDAGTNCTYLADLTAKTAVNRHFNQDGHTNC